MPLFQQTTRPVRVQRLLRAQPTLPITRARPPIDGAARLLAYAEVA